MRAESIRRAFTPGLLSVLALLFAAPGTCAPSTDWHDSAASARRIIVAVADVPDPAVGVGATPRGYGGMPAYSGSARGAARAAGVARDHGLRELAAWSIESLRLRCAVYELPTDAARDAVLARLAADPRVRIAQPLQVFETLSTPSDAPAAYDDPYLGLQHNLAAIGGIAAQHWTRGDGARVAVIDTGVDAGHPDLTGRIVAQRDFVDDGATHSPPERHGTEIAGTIAARAGNGVGIVGVAPEARVLAYRACWSLGANAASARCNSFTLALALGAAISARVDVINLSLGGPRDPLLEQLVADALARGIVVVGAIPASGARDGFPVAIAGVLAVAAYEDGASMRASLRAPGRDILSLQPGGGFDYASGSSFAAAQVSGVVALLRSLGRHIDARGVGDLLARSHRGDGPINACRAIAELRGASVDCDPVAGDSVPP